MSEVLLYQKIVQEVNTFISKAEPQVLVEVANKVFEQEWEYFQYRKLFRIDGFDTGQSRVLTKFYKLYGDASPNDIVNIYNYIHNAEYVYDSNNNILKNR